MRKRKKSKNISSKRTFSISFWFGAVIVLGLFGHFLYTIVYNTIKNRSIDKNGKKITAVVISEKNYMGNSPVTHSYSFSYQFEYKGKKYRGDTHDPGYEVDDSIQVVFVPSHPEFNRPVDNEE